MDQCNIVDPKDILWNVRRNQYLHGVRIQSHVGPADQPINHLGRYGDSGDIIICIIDICIGGVTPV